MLQIHKNAQKKRALGYRTLTDSVLVYSERNMMEMLAAKPKKKNYNWKHISFFKFSNVNIFLKFFFLHEFGPFFEFFCPFTSCTDVSCKLMREFPCACFVFFPLVAVHLVSRFVKPRGKHKKTPKFLVPVHPQSFASAWVHFSPLQDLHVSIVCINETALVCHPYGHRFCRT